jgi:hypothetical protein
MKAVRTILILAAITAVPLLPLIVAQNQAAGTNGTTAAPSALKILSPAAGEIVRKNFVTVRYDVTNARAAGGSSHFRLQVDSRDPVTTGSNEYTFTGLQAGEHTVSVHVLDANNAPVATARSEVRFNVAQPGTPQTARLEEASVAPAEDPNLPPASSALPLLSVIGFGALLGGIASALKTR